MSNLGHEPRATAPVETVRTKIIRRSADAGVTDGPAAREAHLRELTDRVLRRAAATMGPDDLANAGVRELVQRVCILAHERGLRAEQLLLLLKAAWRELPEGRRPQQHDAGGVLARVITVCIHEYYARSAADR